MFERMSTFTGIFSRAICKNSYDAPISQATVAKQQWPSNHEQTPPNAQTPDAINPPRRKQRDQFSGWVELRLDHFANFLESGSRSDLLFDRFVRKTESTGVVRLYSYSRIALPPACYFGYKLLAYQLLHTWRFLCQIAPTTKDWHRRGHVKS